jgi:hypothetical protein
MRKAFFEVRKIGARRGADVWLDISVARASNTFVDRSGDFEWPYESRRNAHQRFLISHHRNAGDWKLSRIGQA